MKKIFLFAIAVVTMGLVSCDIDNVENIGEMSTSEFPKTDGDIEAVLAGVYQNLNTTPDIERIDVLKDAASCAIYGSAAANGVILVTTKQGKEGSVGVDYDGNIGWSNIYRLPQMLTAKEYMQVMDMVRFNTGESVRERSNYFKGNYASLLEG